MHNGLFLLAAYAVAFQEAARHQPFATVFREEGAGPGRSRSDAKNPLHFGLTFRAGASVQERLRSSR